jgi:hypothetical protein
MPDLPTPSNPEHGERKHHPFSPSKLDYFAACPSFQSTEGTNEAAIRGTMQHEASESLDFSKLTQREADGVRSYLQFIENAKAEMGDDTMEFMEIKVKVDDFDTTSGFLDRALLNKDATKAHIIDLKTGFGDINHASVNLQGCAYAIGFRRRFPTVREIKVSFVTPYQATFESTHTFTADELDEEYRNIVAVVDRAKKAKADGDFAMATPSLATCRFCAHYLTKCDKTTSLMSTVGKHMPVAFIDPETMATTDDPAVMSRVLDLLKFLDEFAKPLKNRITEIAKSGVEIPGYSLVSISEREVISPTEAMNVLEGELLNLGKSSTEVAELVKGATVFKLSAAESVVSDLCPRGEKKKGIAAFRDRLRESGAIMDASPKVFLKRELKSISAETRAEGLGVSPDFGGGWL